MSHVPCYDLMTRCRIDVMNRWDCVDVGVAQTQVAILLGFASAVVDNVPLVAATQGMYDLTAHPANDALWNLICYCAATGGLLKCAQANFHIYTMR
eukprot:1219122-Amphidinium_carterae.2